MCMAKESLLMFVACLDCLKRATKMLDGLNAERQLLSASSRMRGGINEH